MLCYRAAPVFSKEVVEEKAGIDSGWVRADEGEPAPQASSKALRNDGIAIESCLIGEDDIPRPRLYTPYPIAVVPFRDVAYLRQVQSTIFSNVLDAQEDGPFFR